jgi:hypothetical protein
MSEGDADGDARVPPGRSGVGVLTVTAPQPELK